MVNTCVDVRCLYVYPVGCLCRVKAGQHLERKIISGFTLAV